jgi:hypothetical protein
MEIDLEKLSAHELALLIKSASAELESRLNQTPVVQRIPAIKKVVTLREPPEYQKDFVLMIKAALQKNTYATADERRRVAAIAAEYPEWIKRQGLPTTHNAGDWNRMRQQHSATRARER